MFISKTNNIITFILFVCSFSLFSQNNSYQFKTINTNNGLSNNSVTCIYKSRFGFVWIGTTDGLNRYDGYTFVVYKHDPSDSNSISDNFISGIVEDFDGNLWIGTQGGGLNKYDPCSNKFYSFYHSDVDNNSLPSNFIFHHNAMFLDSDTILWIGTDHGLCNYIINRNIFNRFKLFAYNTEIKDVRVIYEDENNDDILWIGTNMGMIKFSKTNGHLKVFINEPNNPQSISNNIITSIIGFRNNELWIGTEDGLNKFDKSKEKFIRYISRKGNKNAPSDNSITYLIKDSFENIWIGTKSGGLNKYNYYENSFISFTNQTSNKFGFTDNYIDYLYYDNDGILWLGTVNNGINFLDIKDKKIKVIKHDPSNFNSLSYNTIRSLYEDREGNIWIGTYGGGLNKYNKKTFLHYFHEPGNNNSLNHNIVSALYEDNKGNMWIGTWGGSLDILEKKTGKIFHSNFKIPDFVQDIYEDNNKNIWIACNGGMFLYDINKNKAFRFDSDTIETNRLTANSVSKIIKDIHNNLWVTTFNGLNKIILRNSDKPEIDTIIHYKKEINNINSLSENRLISLFLDKKGNLWIGTYTGGLNLLKNYFLDYRNKPVEFKHFTDKDGLAGNIVYGIIADNNNNLWLSTNNGISMLNTKTLEFQNYNVDDISEGNQFYWNAYLKCKDGTIYFGGINGLYYFNPDSIHISDKFSKVIITDLLLFNKSVPVGKRKEGREILRKAIFYTDEIKLSRKDYAFTFEFAALQFRSQNKIKYAYRLENFDPQWIITDSKKRYATYSHLRPGEYSFKVKSTNEDGIWNKDYTQIKVIVLPAIYETKWAFLVYIIVLILLLLYFRSQILARARFKHEIQLERIEREKTEEYNDLKLRFFTNISHEFRTPLTLITGPLENLLSLKNIDENIKEQLLLIKNGSKRLLRLINQVLEFRKVETGNFKLNVAHNDIIILLNEIAVLFKSRAIHNKISYTLNMPVNSAVVWFDDNIVETIVYNLLSNAFKFTPQNGSILLSVDFYDKNNNRIIPNGDSAEYIIISVTDTGIGIPKDKIELIFKRFYQVTQIKNNIIGTGIGLALCKDLVDIHHGVISVESNEGQGTSFHVKIPVAKSFYSEDEINNEFNYKITTTFLAKQLNDGSEVIVNDDNLTRIIFNEPLIANAPKILIIEDDIELVRFIGKLLEKKYKILIANNGHEGIKILIEEEPDLVISDIMMPEMDGIELCEKIKNDIRISHIPIILLTALSSIDDKIKGLATGADDYISKPFYPEHLLVRIEKLIEQRKKLRLHFEKEINIIPDLASLPSLDEQLLKKVIKYIEDNLAEPNLNVETLSSFVGMSSTHLYRKIKSLTGFSTNELIRKIRLKKAAQLLALKQGSISEVMYKVGFSSQSYFAKCFFEEFGVMPKEYIKSINK